MRIITGSAKGCRLETLEGTMTRPTAERVKEALFSMIQFDLEGRRVLDLFAGSGQLGLEALSRGAATATLVDHSADAAELIKRNARKTKLYERCRVLPTDWVSFIRLAAKKEKFDIIFADPPYGEKLIPTVLKRIMEADLLAERGLFVCEDDEKEAADCPGLTLLRHNRYRKTYLSLYTRISGEPSGIRTEGEGV